MSLPDFIDPELWDAYCEMRKEMGKRAPFTDAAKRLTIKRLVQMDAQGFDANSSLEQSVMRGWRGVFEAERKSEVKRGIDPALQKIMADSQKAAPMPAEIRQRLQAIKGTV